MGRLRLPRTRRGPLRKLAGRRLIEQLDDEPVRLILTASGRLARYAGWLARELDVPLGAMVMGEDETAAVISLRDKLRCVFAGSEPLAKRLRSRFRDKSDLIHQVNLGVHVREKTAAFTGERIRAVVGVGPLTPGNNFDQLLAACAHLKERGYQAIYFIVGSGPAEHKLRELADARELGESFTIVPDLHRLERICDGIDVLVQPFVCRRLDLRLLEAMAAGVAVVARNGGAIDLLRDGENGIELKQGDEAELTLVLQRLLDDPQMGRRLGDNAREFVREHHLAGSTVQKLTTVVREVAMARRTLKMPSG
jgi:glycosyltransferase involved in cell wall biosynthesis